jgi:hypothetical protein
MLFYEAWQMEVSCVTQTLCPVTSHENSKYEFILSIFCLVGRLYFFTLPRLRSKHPLLYKVRQRQHIINSVSRDLTEKQWDLR